MNQLYILGEHPATPQDKVITAFADDINDAIQSLNEILGVTLREIGGNCYSDGTRNFFLYHGEDGLIRFANLFQGKKFTLGQIAATPGALAAFANNDQRPVHFLIRHQMGDWGEVCAEDKVANDDALKHGSRILSAYRLTDGTRIWIVTEAANDFGERASTCILLPDDY